MSYPSPQPTIQAAFDFEDLLLSAFNSILTNDSYLSSIGVGIYVRRSVGIQATPRIELDVDMSANMDYMSFVSQGSPLRQVPNAFIGTVTMRVVTTRAIDNTAQLHGLIRGRCRYILSASANLIGSLSPLQYLQILELLPSSATMDVQPEKDTDTTFLVYRMKFALNDWTWPIVTIPPASVSVTHPASASFTPQVFPTVIQPSTFQWQVSTNGGGSWSNTSDGSTYSGSLTAALTILTTTTAMNGYQYRLIISCAAYSSTVTSASATLTVN